MNRINFYANNDVLEFLQGLSYDFDHETVDLSVDFVNIVATLRLSNTDTGWEFSLIKRIEGLGNDEESGISLGKILVDKATRTGQLDSSQVNENECYALFDIVKNLGCYIQENNILANIGDFDPDEAGVMITTDGNTLSFEEVSGRNRPYLMCFDWLGNVSLGRPYIDEAMDSFSLHSESFEERLEDANNGDEDAMLQVALDYLNGDDVDIDPEKAYYWFVKCAEAGGSGQAMFNVGLLTAKGFGVERDFAKAAEWMQKAADEEDEDAKACVDEYRKLADATEKAIAGDAQAQADLASGLMKLSGSLIQAGEDKDFEESVMWAEKAVAQGCPDGYWILALAYHHGRGVEQDIDKAIEIYQKGADAGNAPCQHNLGCQYMSGENIEKDRHKGFALIKAAAEQGYGLAMKDLGECYQFAIGTPGNMKTAYEWYEKALEVIDDKELEQKVMMLGMISTTDHFDEDYPEDNEDYPGDDEDYPEYDEDYLEDDEDFDGDFPEEDEELDDDEENAGGEEFLINRNVLLRYDGEDENVVIPEGITAIGDGSYMTFLDKKVVSVKIPDTVTSIGAYGFFGCDTLPEIDIPDSVVSIGHHAFRQCTSLKSVTIPDSISCIERECFWSCTGIEEVKLPKNLKFIEEKAFSGCISLRSVVIPEGTEVIDDCAFWGDESLESITIPASVKRIGEMAFADCNNLTIYAPKGSNAERYAKKHRISYKTK